MHKNGHNSTSGQIFYPKFEIPMGCFLFKYEFWWCFCPDLYSKTSLTRTSGDRPRTSALTEVRVIQKLKKVIATVH